MTRRHPGGSAITIREVASAAKVSVATASRALTGSGPASPAARRRVLAVARRLGYRPSPHARRLRGTPTKTIGVLLPAFAPLHAEWLRGASEVARRNDYVLLVCNGEHSMRLMAMQLERLLAERVDGLLLAGSIPAPREIGRFVDAGIPVGPDLTHRARGRPIHHAQFRPATLAAFRHLVAVGHREIAYLVGIERDEGYVSTMQRMRIGCLREALSEVGETPRADLLVPLDPLDGAGSVDAVRALASRRGTPTAIVAGLPLLTIPLVRGVRAAGRRIPDDVSILAFDESGWEELHTPPISVVRHDYHGIAAALTEDLIARIESREPSGPPPSAFACEFIVRASIGPPPRVPDA
jgi:LacI family transcriptional regulator, galactose operon repressor